MKRFIFISVIFHTALLLLLFAWEIPLTNKIVPHRVILVSLIEKGEEKESQIGQSAIKAKPEIRNFRRKEILQPREEKGERKLAQATWSQEIRNEEESGREENLLKNKPPAANPGVVLEAQIKDPSSTAEDPGILPTASNLSQDPGGGEEKGSVRSAGPVAYLASSASPGETGEIGGAGKRNSDPARGDGSTLQISRGHSSVKESDQILQQILRKIEAAKRYPKAAWKMRIEGITTVRFKLKPGGEVESVEVVESSGSEILDRASLETVRDAAPLPYKEGWLKVGIVFKIL